MAQVMYRVLGDDIASEPVNVNHAKVSDLLQYKALILGAPSYGIGELPGRTKGSQEGNWEEFLFMSNNQNNAECIAQFCRYIAERKPELKKRYEQLLAQDLSLQQWDGCFQRNVLTALEQAYDEALAHLQTLPFDNTAIHVNRGMSDLSK